MGFEILQNFRLQRAFRFLQFLLDEPWDLYFIIVYNIMYPATDRIYDMADDDLIEDKKLQISLLQEGDLRSGGQVDQVYRCVQGAVSRGSDEAGEDAAQGDGRCDDGRVHIRSKPPITGVKS